MAAQDFSLRDQLSSSGDSFGDRVSSIILWGPACKITLKAHFGLETAIQWAALAMSVEEDEVEDQIAVDFLREFSNLHAGYLRGLFEKVGIPLGISLPFVMMGGEESILKALKNENHAAMVWRLASDQGEIVCTAEIEMVDNARLEGVIDKLNEIVAQEAEDDGKVEFLA